MAWLRIDWRPTVRSLRRLWSTLGKEMLLYIEMWKAAGRTGLEMRLPLSLSVKN